MLSTHKTLGSVPSKQKMKLIKYCETFAVVKYKVKYSNLS